MITMIRTAALRVLSPVILIGFTAALAAQSPAPLPGGESTYGLYCATCHGPTGRGDGPMAQMLSKRPADLSRIAVRNKGVFDAALVARVIDGRSPVKGHGGGEMPVWGDAFSRSSDPTPVTDKIERLVSFISSIQQR